MPAWRASWAVRSLTSPHCPSASAASAFPRRTSTSVAGTWLLSLPPPVGLTLQPPGDPLGFRRPEGSGVGPEWRERCWGEGKN